MIGKQTSLEKVKGAAEAFSSLSPPLAAELRDSEAPDAGPEPLQWRHYQMQRGNFIARCEPAPFGWMVFSEISAAPMWNHAAWARNGFDAEKSLESIREAFDAADRCPTVYVTEGLAGESPWQAALQAAGFEPFDRESWMVYGGRHRAGKRPAELRVARAASEPAISDFIEVFCAAYKIQEKDYAATLRRQLRDPGGADAVQHWIAYAEGRGATTATLMEAEKFGGVYNVGTAPWARRRGYGAAIMEEIIRESERAGQTVLFLQVDAGSSTEQLYERLGFQRLFMRRGFRLKEWRPGARAAAGPLRLALGAASARRAAEWSCVTAPLDGWRAEPWLAEAGLASQALFSAAWAMTLVRYCGIDPIQFGLRRGGAEAVITFDCEPDELVIDCCRRIERDFAPSGGAAVESWLSLEGAPLQRRRGAAIEARVALDAGAVEFWFPEALLDRRAVERFAAHFVRALGQMRRRPRARLREIQGLDPSERAQLEHWGAGAGQFAPDLDLPSLIRARALEQPDACALRLARADGVRETMSYGELQRRSDRWADRLRPLGAPRQPVAAICLERSLAVVPAILALWKAGVVCVPLDPEHPKKRLEQILDDSGAALVLTQRKFQNRFGHGRKLALLEELDQTELAPARRADSRRTIGRVAYVIYTSGSTGSPKGVAVSHAVLANHCRDMAEYYGLNSSDVALQFSPHHFDAAFEQIFCALLSGACLAARGPELWDAKQLTEMLATLGVTVADLPTAYWRHVLQEWAEHPAAPQTKLRLVIVGGEALPPETARLWRRVGLRGVRWVNAYGPTEAAITATCFEAGQWDPGDAARAPIGRPRAARRVMALDRWGDCAPIGAPGEICISGPLLADGYWNRPQQTAEKFPADPAAGGRVYRTGDLGRFLPDGNLEFLGRLDDQVKVRGFRIETGEVEAALHQHPAVRSAAVAARGQGAEARLAAFVIANKNAAPSERELRQFLEQRLPEHMIPGDWFFLEALPVTASGKIDRRKLAEGDFQLAPPACRVKGPSDPLELQLQLIFERALKRRPIGVDQSFFELGGDSLQALEVVVEMERATGRAAPLGVLFQSSTVEALARSLRERSLAPEWSCLAPMQPFGRRPPLILIHTTPGDALGYGNLIYHLGSDQPCYGFQSRGLHRVELAHHRIEEMAQDYVRLLREFQPRGPYYLGGWCYGGIVAVEMARQLREQGQTIGLLALMETVAPAPPLRVFRFYLHRLGCLARMNPRRWWIYLREKARYYRRSQLANRMRFRQVGAAEGLGDQERQRRAQRLAQLEEVYRINLRALRRFRARYYPGKVTLFNAREQDPALIPDVFYGWPGLAAEIEIHAVPGDHDTMLAEPHAKVLADAIRQCLDAAQAQARLS